jgi:hypothetical protein
MVINEQTLVGEYQGMCLTFLVLPETVSNVERFRQLSFTKDCMYDVSSSAALLAMTLSLICSPVVAHLEELRQLAEWTLSWLNSPRPSASK